MREMVSVSSCRIAAEGATERCVPATTKHATRVCRAQRFPGDRRKRTPLARLGTHPCPRRHRLVRREAAAPPQGARAPPATGASVLSLGT